MRIVCWQTILIKYHSLFLSKIGKDFANLSSAAVVIGALRVNTLYLMDFPIHIDTISMGMPIVYFKGSYVKLSIL